MNRNENLSAISSLANSQGFYSRLYNQIKDNDEALEYLEQQNFNDVVDMVMFLES